MTMVHVISADQVREAMLEYVHLRAEQLTSMAHLFATAGSVRVIDGVRVHVVPFEDAEDAYGWTQSAEECKCGDLIVWGRTVAVLDRAWPVTVRGDGEAFHRLKDGVTFETHEGGKYAHAARIARSLRLTPF
ncbi:hypothetical protein FAZ95_38675 [Trinickia violacea]|uniref:Uncharacterized protein n=1 Tax=Trinickia violacea TaxID=2571746 RepID=A0A4P8J7F1_9BURK|nr:hypothetical protein [Trinickia violacea]QCP55069.1 hypothetical protein FAZ95_38675 [Trinickia violacea]